MSNEARAPSLCAETFPRPRVRRWLHIRNVGAMVGLTALALGWLLPPLGGLNLQAQRTLGLIFFTIAWCGFGVAPEGLVSVFFFLLAIMTRLGTAREVLVGWTDPVVWFNIAAMGLGLGVEKTGLGRRLALLIITRGGVRYSTLVAIIFGANVVLGLGGVASIGRIAILLPITIGVCTAAGLKPADTGYRGLVITVLSASLTSGLLFYTASGLNPVAMQLAGNSILYSTWIVLFSPVVLAMMAITAWVIPQLWPVGRPLVVDTGSFHRELVALGPLSAGEKRLIGILVFALVLWNLDFWHGIHPTWIALLAAALMMSPVLGVTSFAEFARTSNWNTNFFIGAMMGVATLIHTSGLDTWLAGVLRLLPLPAAPVGFMLGVGLLALVLHILAGSPMATMSIAIPAVAAYGIRLGYRTDITAFVVYAMLWTQMFFPYQHIATIFMIGQPGFTGPDLRRYGLMAAVITLLAVLLVGVPYWSLLGVLG